MLEERSKARARTEEGRPARLSGRLDRRLAIYLKPRLLILDELGYLPLDPLDAANLFRLVQERYCRLKDKLRAGLINPFRETPATPPRLPALPGLAPNLLTVGADGDDGLSPGRYAGRHPPTRRLA